MSETLSEENDRLRAEIESWRTLYRGAKADAEHVRGRLTGALDELERLHGLLTERCK